MTSCCNALLEFAPFTSQPVVLKHATSLDRKKGVPKQRVLLREPLMVMHLMK